MKGITVLLFTAIFFTACKKTADSSSELNETIWELQHHTINDIPVKIGLINSPFSVNGRLYYVLKTDKNVEAHFRFNFIEEDEISNTPEFIRGSIMTAWMNSENERIEFAQRFPRVTVTWSFRKNVFSITEKTFFGNDPRAYTPKEKRGRVEADKLFIEYKETVNGIEETHRQSFLKVDYVPEQLQY